MRHIIRLLTDDKVVGILPEHILPECTAPILFVATNLSVASMLTSHEGATTWSTYRTACISLSEAHSLFSHSVDIRSGDVLLPITTQIAITHVVTHYIYYVRVRLGEKRQRQSAKERYYVKFRVNSVKFIGFWAQSYEKVW